MKRFRFRLDQVLHVRRVQEDMARVDAAARATATRTLAADARRTNGSPTTPTAQHARRRRSRTTTSNARAFRLDSAAGAVGVARAAHRDALDVVDDRRADWTDARRRVAALERLEERRRDEHAIEVQRAEDQLVDDLVVARHARGARA